MKPQNFILHHYWRSSCSWRVRWALDLKKISFESKPVNLLKGEHKENSFKSLNQSGQVPCLQVGDQFFSESLSIIEWLDDVFPEVKLVSGTPERKRLIRELSYKISSGVQPIQNLSVMRAYSAEKSKQRIWSKQWITKGFEVYETLLQKSATRFSVGSQITLADLCLIPQVYNAKRFNVSLDSFPKIERVYHNALETKEAISSHPDVYA